MLNTVGQEAITGVCHTQQFRSLVVCGTNTINAIMETHDTYIFIHATPQPRNVLNLFPGNW